MWWFFKRRLQPTIYGSPLISCMSFAFQSSQSCDYPCWLCPFFPSTKPSIIVVVYCLTMSFTVCWPVVQGLMRSSPEPQIPKIRMRNMWNLEINRETGRSMKSTCWSIYWLFMLVVLWLNHFFTDWVKKACPTKSRGHDPLFHFYFKGSGAGKCGKHCARLLVDITSLTPSFSGLLPVGYQYINATKKYFRTWFAAVVCLM